MEKKWITIARSLTEQMTFKTPKSDRERTVIVTDTLCAILRTDKAKQAEA
jgi:hypothetical protein